MLFLQIPPQSLVVSSPQRHPEPRGSPVQLKHTETQIASILKEADASISAATDYKGKAKYGGLEASDMQRLKEHEHENSRLKRLCAGFSLENATLKECSQKSSKAR